MKLKSRLLSLNHSVFIYFKLEYLIDIVNGVKFKEENDTDKKTHKIIDIVIEFCEHNILMSVNFDVVETVKTGVYEDFDSEYEDRWYGRKHDIKEIIKNAKITKEERKIDYVITPICYKYDFDKGDFVSINYVELRNERYHPFDQEKFENEGIWRLEKCCEGRWKKHIFKQ